MKGGLHIGMWRTQALLLVVLPQLLGLVLDDVHQVELISCRKASHLWVLVCFADVGCIRKSSI